MLKNEITKRKDPDSKYEWVDLNANLYQRNILLELKGEKVACGRLLIVVYMPNCILYMPKSNHKIYFILIKIMYIYYNRIQIRS